jgi:acetylornithine deacetylase/succinyl-diaminopimelate desuccinylase-like protein
VTTLASALAYAAAHRPRFVAELKEFIRVPSVSSQPVHQADVKRCAAWLARHLRGIGMKNARVIETNRHPLVYAERREAGSRPTVLIYGHYDVQPPDPMDQWRSPPFQPAVRGANLYGRGASDDKGQMFTHVKAIESLLRTKGSLPVNVKCIFEGEEEIGSPSLRGFLTRNKRALAASCAVISDMPILGPNRPAITSSLRGALALELSVRGPKRDLHSGMFGGAVRNPIQALSEIIAKLHQPDGRVAIPGFYKSVRPLPASERAQMRRVGPSDSRFVRDAGAARTWGEPGFTAYERTTVRPALTINGITGGYQGPGGKGIIPSRASAKLGFRLVADQDPAEIQDLLQRYLDRIVPPSIDYSVTKLSASKPAIVDRSHPAIRSAARAYESSFGAAPVFRRSGGSIPVVSLFEEVLGVPTVLMGFGLPDDGMHGPNEKFYLPNFYRGIATSITFLNNL